MNERQLTAIQACEKSARAIAKRHGWDEPHFYMPHSDTSIEFWRAAEALSIFLMKVEKADKASMQATKIVAKLPSVPVIADEREEKASEPTVRLWSEPVTIGTATSAASTTFPTGTTETVVSPNTPLTLTEHQSANFDDVVGIGRETQAMLYAAGYLTWEDILQAGIIKLREEFPGINASRLRALFTRAQREAE